jgi:hypothetical protein
VTVRKEDARPLLPDFADPEQLHEGSPEEAAIILAPPADRTD